uniref:Fork-head domain-containing protein n=1 Tax=Macrostomum lignano TaxID=282301 RepID=A0A1I8IVV9_9PLAT
CICGRVFHTVRRPGNSVRPSTLADARRHVMGVHARISHEMLTTCCQASRISRENNWHLYADEMLLRLANERPAKASTNFASAPRSLDDSALSNQNSRLDESGCGPGEDSCSMLTGESQQRGDDAGKKQQQPEFSSLLYSSHPVWPGETGKLLKSSSSAALGLIADSEHRAAAISPTASPAGASSAGGLSTSTPTMLGRRPGQPHEVATQEQRLASLRVLEEEGRAGAGGSNWPYSFIVSACSRLSRDDNRLDLPDPLLIQLARLKWKRHGRTERGKTRQGRRCHRGLGRLFRLQLAVSAACRLRPPPLMMPHFPGIECRSDRQSRL